MCDYHKVWPAGYVVPPCAEADVDFAPFCKQHLDRLFDLGLAEVSFPIKGSPSVTVQGRCHEEG